MTAVRLLPSGTLIASGTGSRCVVAAPAVLAAPPMPTATSAATARLTMTRLMLYALQVLDSRAGVLPSRRNHEYASRARSRRYAFVAQNSARGRADAGHRADFQLVG